ncbi:MAG: hypothetical protein AAFZ05_04660, partial [Pseudomonadota bacterium]
ADGEALSCDGDGCRGPLSRPLTGLSAFRRVYSDEPQFFACQTQAVAVDHSGRASQGPVRHRAAATTAPSRLLIDQAKRCEDCSNNADHQTFARTAPQKLSDKGLEVAIHGRKSAI